MSVHLRNYIGGRWMDACSHTFRDRVDPAEGTLLVQFADSDEDDVEEAVFAANAALPAWRAMPAPTRGDILHKTSMRILAELDSLAEILTREQGKTLAESKSELRRAAEAFEFCAGETRRFAGETLPSESAGRLVMTLREPLGVVGLVTPGNYPAQLAAWKIGPALAMGNTVVFKPSELTPWISTRLVEMLAASLEASSAPSGVINLVTGGPSAGAALAIHHGVAGLSFTGSVDTGLTLQQKVAARGGRALCEMGGKNPLVVLDDADLALAAGACVRGAFGNAGQRCTATSRAIVHPSLYEKFLAEVVRRAGELRVGPGMDPASEMGPLASAEGLEKVSAAVRKAEEAGAKILCGGKRATGGNKDHGWFYQPTVIAGAAPDSAIAQDEVFGPVIVVQTAMDDADALAVANGVRFGLSASVFTRSLDRALYFARGFESGIVHVNSPTVGGETHVPFAGMKATSNGGGRERGAAASDFYTRWKTVYIDTDVKR